MSICPSVDRQLLTLDLFNTWKLSGEEQNKLDEYWTWFEEHVKPQSNHILNRYYLQNLRRKGRPFDNFLTEAKLLIQNNGYLSELQDELLRDALVFGIDSDIVWKNSIAKGNDLTLKKPREIILLPLMKLPGYSSKQLQVKRVQHKSTHYTEPKTTPNQTERPERQQSPLVCNYLVEARGEKTP